MGMSTAFSWTSASPTIYGDLQPESPSLSPKQPLCPPAAPPPSLPSLGTPTTTPPPKPPTGCGRPWTCLFCVMLILFYLPNMSVFAAPRGVSEGQGLLGREL